MIQQCGMAKQKAINAKLQMSTYSTWYWMKDLNEREEINYSVSFPKSATGQITSNNWNINSCYRVKISLNNSCPPRFI